MVSVNRPHCPCRRHVNLSVVDHVHVDMRVRDSARSHEKTRKLAAPPRLRAYCGGDRFRTTFQATPRRVAQAPHPRCANQINCLLSRDAVVRVAINPPVDLQDRTDQVWVNQTFVYRLEPFARGCQKAVTRSVLLFKTVSTNHVLVNASHLKVVNSPCLATEFFRK